VYKFSHPGQCLHRNVYLGKKSWSGIKLEAKNVYQFLFCRLSSDFDLCHKLSTNWQYNATIVTRIEFKCSTQVETSMAEQEVCLITVILSRSFCHDHFVAVILSRSFCRDHCVAVILPRSFFTVIFSLITVKQRLRVKYLQWWENALATYTNVSSFFSFKKIPLYTLAGIDLTTHNSSLFGGRLRTIPLDYIRRQDNTPKFLHTYVHKLDQSKHIFQFKKGIWGPSCPSVGNLSSAWIKFFSA
jgi:hypothetical protein